MTRGFIGEGVLQNRFDETQTTQLMKLAKNRRRLDRFENNFKPIAMK